MSKRSHKKLKVKKPEPCFGSAIAFLIFGYFLLNAASREKILIPYRCYGGTNQLEPWQTYGAGAILCIISLWLFWISIKALVLNKQLDSSQNKRP
jgi:hypothetical protein